MGIERGGGVGGGRVRVVLAVKMDSNGDGHVLMMVLMRMRRMTTCILIITAAYGSDDGVDENEKDDNLYPDFL